ncbi:MAG TPA: ABC transporter permease [Firmicutes bacterium]|jgi:putative ABC transport system permease protein|nr:ABC transporter permease [Bacillota bacterium]
MLFLTRLAFKNLARHRNRTVITSIIIAFAVLSYILYDSLIGGMIEMSYATIIDYETGHLQVMTREYWEKETEEKELPLEHLFTLDEELEREIQEVEGFLAAAPELNFQARLGNGVDELPVIGKGIDPEAFGRVFALEDRFVEGSMFAPGENRAVLGKRLADLMDLAVGDYITLLVKDKDGSYNTIDAEIAGLVHTSNPNVNQNIVYLPLDIVEQGLNTPGEVSKVIIRLENKDLASKLAGELGGQLQGSAGNLAVYPWDEMEAVTFIGAAEIEKQLIFAIILLIGAIAVINTVILAALERMGEIGMMKALGLQNKEVVYAFVLESTGIGMIGGILGVLMGVGGVWPMVKYGVDFAGLVSMDLASFGLPILGRLYGVWNPAGFAWVFLFVVIVSSLSSILPAYWAANKDPVKTIYHR